jgi:hypothetical protein
MQVKLSYSDAEFVLRQSPDGAGICDGHRFFNDSVDREYDAWVVYEGLAFPQSVCCDIGRTVFVTGEPASIRTYDRRFLAQFAAVISPQTQPHPRVFVQQPAIPWWAGIVVTHQPGKSTAGNTLNYDKFKAVERFEKPSLASVICSNKTMTEGHRHRLALVDRLREEFAGRIDFFGHGSKPVADKWDAIEPYRFHIVFENVRAPHYWSEKLADAFLAGAVPIYCGCPNASDYFPPGSFIPIDRGQPEEAIGIIRQALAADDYDRRRPAVAEARRRVLDEYNLFPVLSKVLDQLSSGGRGKVTIRPEIDFTDRIARRIKRKVKRIAFGVGPRSG